MLFLTCLGRPHWHLSQPVICSPLADENFPLITLGFLPLPVLMDLPSTDWRNVLSHSWIWVPMATLAVCMLMKQFFLLKIFSFILFRLFFIKISTVLFKMLKHSNTIQFFIFLPNTNKNTYSHKSTHTCTETIEWWTFFFYVSRSVLITICRQEKYPNLILK